MKKLLCLIVLCLLPLTAHTSETAQKEETAQSGSTYDAVVGWGKDMGGRLSEKVAGEFEALSLSRMGTRMAEVAEQIDAEGSKTAVKQAADMVEKSWNMLTELESGLGTGSEEAQALIEKTKTTLSVTSALLADPESRQDMAEIARNLYAVSKNLKKLSSMVQTSPTKFAWRNLPGVVKYLRNNDFNSILNDVESLASKVEQSAKTELSANDIQNLEGLFAYMSALIIGLDDNLNESAGQQFSEKFRPGITNLRQALEETRPLMNDPEQNSTAIIKKMRQMSQDLRELSEVTLEFPEYLKLWPKP